MERVTGHGFNCKQTSGIIHQLCGRPSIIWRGVEQYQIKSLETGYLLHRTAHYLQDRVRYTQAEPLYQRALLIREQALGPKNLDTAATLHRLALLYQEQGKYELAEPLYQRALLIREQVLGPKHPRTATTHQHYISLLRTMGKIEEAARLEAFGTLPP